MSGVLLLAGLGVLVSTARAAAVPLRALTPAEARRLAQLVPSAQAALHRLRAALARRGIQTFVGQTAQSFEDAAKMYATGRSATKKSWHRVNRAVDLYVVVGGVPDLRAQHNDLYERMGAVARASGWRWLGTRLLKNATTGATFTDPQHLEWREGLTWEQAGG